MMESSFSELHKGLIGIRILWSGEFGRLSETANRRGGVGKPEALLII